MGLQSCAHEIPDSDSTRASVRYIRGYKISGRRQNDRFSWRAAATPREWVLGPESEYRFELDAGTTLGIKVGFIFELLEFF